MAAPLETALGVAKYDRQMASYVFVFSLHLPFSYHLDVVRGPSTPHDPESDAGGSLSSWQGHPSR
jgi:hypothetical protein